MGGAERAERRRRQQELAARRQREDAPTPGRSRTVTAWAAVAVLLLVVVGVGVWLQQRNQPGQLPAAVPVASPAADPAVSVQGATVLAGRPTAPVAIDVFEDYLCPGCAALEDRDGDRLMRAAADGRAVVRYHPVAILDGESDPAGYSTRAAVASLCAARTGIFPAVHASLFDTPPVPGGTGWTPAQLSELGRALGAGEGYTRCLRDDDDRQRVAAATERAAQRIGALRGDGRFGTPTVLVGGELADPGDEAWLDRALRAGR